MEKEKEPGFVAYHEIGHAVVAKRVGADVTKVTIKPEGNAAGHTKISLWRFSGEELVLKMMAILVAGGVALEKAGFSNPWEGAGSDLARLDHLADYASKFITAGKTSAEHFKAKAFAKARSYMPSASHLFHRASLLEQKQTI